MTNIWTVTSDYFATGEGYRQMLLVVTALSEEDALNHFKDNFHEYFAIGAEVHEGVIEHKLIPEHIRESINNKHEICYVHFKTEYYLNCS